MTTMEQVLVECAETTELPAGIESLTWAYLTEERALIVRAEGGILPCPLHIDVQFSLDITAAHIFPVCYSIGCHVSAQLQKASHEVRAVAA